jgi:hypothetical protein
MQRPPGRRAPKTLNKAEGESARRFPAALRVRCGAFLIPLCSSMSAGSRRMTGNRLRFCALPAYNQHSTL